MLAVGRGLSGLSLQLNQHHLSAGSSARYTVRILQIDAKLAVQKNGAEIENGIIKAHRMEQMVRPVPVCKSSAGRFIRGETTW